MLASIVTVRLYSPARCSWRYSRPRNALRTTASSRDLKFVASQSKLRILQEGSHFARRRNADEITIADVGSPSRAQARTADRAKSISIAVILFAFSCSTAMRMATGALPRIARNQSGSPTISASSNALRILPILRVRRIVGFRVRHQMSGETGEKSDANESDARCSVEVIRCPRISSGEFTNLPMAKGSMRVLREEAAAFRRPKILSRIQWYKRSSVLRPRRVTAENSTPRRCLTLD